LLAQLHAPDLTYHFHGDHLLALLLNISAGQLNTLVNFESALLGLDGQFSVGGNNQLTNWDSLIVAAALLADCDTLYSEDMQHGRLFENSLKVINPFA
jgi:hypothetical protein